jgi:hypothetical protein
MQGESWPLRKGDMLFVVAVVMLAFALPSRAATAVLVAGAVLVWIRFRVYGSRDQRNTPR